MTRRKRSLCGVVFAAGLVSSTARTEAADARGSLKGCVIHAAAGQPAFVERSIDDLGRIVETFSGVRPERMSPAETSARLRGQPVIEIGLAPPADIGASAGLPADPPAEAYVVRAKWIESNGKRVPLVQIGAVDAAGLKFGIVALMHRLRVGNGAVTIDVPLQVARAPRFATRSMYAHLHWWYQRPYALRAWPIEDWKRYLDLLTYLGFNTIQIWPMMELLPHPLSDADRAYLEKYADVIDYAHTQRGMRAFIGSCPNNITEDAKGVPIERREYFDFAKRLDPGDAKNLERLLDYRSDLYRTVPDADGYWVIDSDPGGWPDSPTSEFVDILLGHRKLIDRYGTRPSEQPVIYWMWESWGTGTRERNARDALAGLKQRMDGPWRVHLCKRWHLEVARELGALDRGIWFPYNLIEDEPSGPLTDLRLARIQESLRDATAFGLHAIQGNAQTPLVQLPNIAAFAEVGWGGNVEREGDRLLQELASQFLCKDTHTLAAAWKSLTAKDAPKSLALAAELTRLAADESARGPIAVIIGDWQSRVIEDLAMILPIHAYAVRFAEQVDADAAPETLRETFTAYLESAGRWFTRTGYHNKRILVNEAYRECVLRAMSKLRVRMGESEYKEQIVWPARAQAARDLDYDLINTITYSVLGNP